MQVFSNRRILHCLQWLQHECVWHFAAFWFWKWMMWCEQCCVFANFVEAMWRADLRVLRRFSTIELRKSVQGTLLFCLDLLVDAWKVNSLLNCLRCFWFGVFAGHWIDLAACCWVCLSVCRSPVFTCLIKVLLFANWAIQLLFLHIVYDIVCLVVSGLITTIRNGFAI